MRIATRLPMVEVFDIPEETKGFSIPLPGVPDGREIHNPMRLEYFLHELRQALMQFSEKPVMFRNVQHYRDQVTGTEGITIYVTEMHLDKSHVDTQLQNKLCDATERGFQASMGKHKAEQEAEKWTLAWGLTAIIAVVELLILMF